MAGNNGRRIDPAYQWYPGDWFASEKAQCMTWAERGLYREILDFQWANGDLPGDLRRLARLIGATMEELEAAWRSSLGECFEVSEDGQRMWNPRLRREQDVREDYRAEQAERSTAGHNKRWGPKCSVCSKRQGPVADPCLCNTDGHAVGDAERHAKVNAETMPPIPSHPIPSSTAQARTTPSHLEEVVEQQLVPLRVRVEERWTTGKGSIHRIPSSRYQAALRALVLGAAADMAPRSDQSVERQQAKLRAALRDGKIGERIFELMELAEQGPKHIPAVKNALYRITEEGV